MQLCDKFEPFFELLSPELEEKHEKIRYVILIGGRGGAKSFGLSAFLNQASYREGWGILFTRWTMTSAKKSIIPEFEAMASDECLNNARDFRFLETQVINNMTDVVTDFSGLKPNSNSSTGALKSISKKNIFVLEEAEDCHNFDIFDKVDNSIRTIKEKNLIIIVLNQGHVGHWIYTEFIAPYLAGERDDIMYVETTYEDNLDYLNDSFINKALKLKAKNLVRYNHIYMNKWQTDTDGAIWVQSDISAHRISKEEYKEDIESQIIEIVIALDPAVTDSAMTEVQRQEARAKGKEPDEDGIIVMGKTRNNHVYVIEDLTCRGTRAQIAKVVVGAYNDYQASCVIVEKNNGGDWIKNALKAVSRNVKVENVTARKNKRIRAEPVQAAYEEGYIHHVGHFPELELEQTTWVYDTGMDSPNHLDALVWGGTWLISEEVHETIFMDY